MQVKHLLELLTENGQVRAMCKHFPRLIDHLVLPVSTLDGARHRYTQLGFTVAPDAKHSFGTENACVNFANGSFLEPLAIGHREKVEEYTRKGNTFLRFDGAYRFRNGENGFSKLAFGEKKPKAMRKAFEKAGYDTGKLVTVRRPGVKVALAFAMDPRSPDVGLFVCERPDGAPKFPKTLTKHRNGAKLISRVVMQEAIPSDFKYYIEQVSGQRNPKSHSFGLDFAMPNGMVSVLNSDGLKDIYGIDKPDDKRGLTLVAFDVRVRSLEMVETILSKNGIYSRTVGPRLIVDPAPGQGAYIAFMEKQ